jgi:uncharacterized protein YndB with AHSA1/START domain
MTARLVGNMQLSTPSDREILMTRTFDAPRRLVWDAFTKPELVRRWLGVHNGWRMETCTMDVRVGGRYRYEWRGPGGMEMGMGGEYREVVPAEKLVATEVFDASWYDGAAVDTTEFVESAGRTTLTIRVLYDSKAVRDAVLATPMEQGMAAGLDALADVLAQQA